MYTNDGWQTICSEPIIKGMVEVDFHGFFYAGTSIRATPVQLNADATNLSVASLFAGPSQMDVTEISNEKPFLTNSFSWRSSIPSNPSTASMSEPNTMSISANGFISFDGNFLNSNTETASKFTKTQKWTTPFVYGIQQLSSGTGINLANTYNPIPYGQTKAAAAVNDTFQQRMYYVQNDDGNISVRLSTDIKMYDKIGATNIAGYKNAALIQYVAADEISNVVDAFATDATIIDYNQVSGLSGQFENPDNYHTFTYGKYLGRPAGTTVLAFNNVTSDFGTPRKSLAFIGIGSEGPNFMRQSKGDRWVYSIGNPDGVECVQTNTLVKNDTFAISTVQGTYIDNPNSDELCGSVKFDYEVLDKNLTGLRCFPVNILSLNKALTASTTVNGKTEWSPKCINYHDIGAPLLSVRFAKNSTATIDDSAFAFCTSLKEIKIPETMSMNGNTTFFMGLSSNLNAQLLKVNNATPSISSINVVP